MLLILGQNSGCLRLSYLLGYLNESEHQFNLIKLWVRKVFETQGLDRDTSFTLISSFEHLSYPQFDQVELVFALGVHSEKQN
jgi:hypothetical protein